MQRFLEAHVGVNYFGSDHLWAWCLPARRDVAIRLAQELHQLYTDHGMDGPAFPGPNQ